MTLENRGECLTFDLQRPDLIVCRLEQRFEVCGEIGLGISVAAVGEVAAEDGCHRTQWNTRLGEPADAQQTHQVGEFVVPVSVGCPWGFGHEPSRW